VEFDKEYMQQLYNVGLAQAESGYRWAKQPPMLVGEADQTQKSR